MTFLRAGRGLGLLLLVAWLGSGCFLEAPGPADEQKEPHYLTGKSRVTAYDYIGAVQAFERALQANPNSASAHLELGLLLSDKEAVLDYAAAIYHLQRYLRLQQNAHNADMIRERVTVCKQGLAREVPLGPVTQQVQREIMKLTAENSRLTNEVMVLRQHLDQMRLYLAQRAVLTPTNPPAQPPVTLPPGLGPSNQPPTRPSAATPPQAPATATNRAAPNLSGPAAYVVPSPAPPAGATNRAPDSAAKPAPPRTHTMRKGETLGGLAKRYGVTLKALQTANPGLNPNRIPVGHKLNIPSP